MTFVSRYVWLLFMPVMISVAGQTHCKPADHQAGFKPILIEGRVVDKEGFPVEGLEVRASAPGMGRYISRAFSSGTHKSLGHGTSDADGRFAVHVPYVGLRYNLNLASYQSHYIRDGDNQSLSVLVSRDEPPEPIELVVTPTKMVPPVTGRVLRSDGTLAAGASVLLCHPEGGRWEATADQDGRFRFVGMRVYESNAMGVLAESGEEIGHAKTLRWNKRRDIEIRLTQPASVSGRLTAEDTGEPLPSARVRFYLTGTGLPAYVTQTDEDGRYRLTGLPPGEYGYSATSDSHVDIVPRGAVGRPTLTLKAGEHAEVDTFGMKPCAILRGRFVTAEGTPIPGAVVAYNTAGGSMRGKQYLVYTDHEGRFAFRSGHFKHHYNPIEAFHPLAGGNWHSITENLSPGQVVDDIVIVAHGVARVRGTVTDTKGNPLVGVNCSYADYGSIASSTDREGRYDLGLFPLRPAEDGRPRQAAMMFLPPRPENIFREAVPDEPGPFYVARSRSLALKPDDLVTEDAQLVQTQRLTLMGTVEDDNGRPKSKAWVYLLPGRVTDLLQQDKKKLQHMINHYDAMRRHEYGRAGEQPEIKPLEDLRVDTQGRWGFAVLRTDSDAMAYRQLLGGYVRPAEAGHTDVKPLDWLTILVVPDEGPYRLYPPKQISDDQTHYVIPAEIEDGGD